MEDRDNTTTTTATTSTPLPPPLTQSIINWEELLMDYRGQSPLKLKSWTFQKKKKKQTKRGKGGMQADHDVIYFGQRTADNVPHGYGRCFFLENMDSYVGHWKLGVFDGLGVYHYNNHNRSTYAGYFLNGNPSGYGCFMNLGGDDETSRADREEQFINNFYAAKGRREFGSSRVIAGEFSEGKHIASSDQKMQQAGLQAWREAIHQKESIIAALNDKTIEQKQDSKSNPSKTDTQFLEWDTNAVDYFFIASSERQATQSSRLDNSKTFEFLKLFKRCATVCGWASLTRSGMKKLKASTRKVYEEMFNKGYEVQESLDINFERNTDPEPTTTTTTSTSTTVTSSTPSVSSISQSETSTGNHKSTTLPVFLCLRQVYSKRKYPSGLVEEELSERFFYAFTSPSSEHCIEENELREASQMLSVDYIINLLHAGVEVILTGHSYGGLMASIVAMRVINTLFRDAQAKTEMMRIGQVMKLVTNLYCVTFGCPAISVRSSMQRKDVGIWGLQNMHHIYNDLDKLPFITRVVATNDAQNHRLFKHLNDNKVIGAREDDLFVFEDDVPKVKQSISVQKNTIENISKHVKTALQSASVWRCTEEGGIEPSSPSSIVGIWMKSIMSSSRILSKFFQSSKSIDLREAVNESIACHTIAAYVDSISSGLKLMEIHMDHLKLATPRGPSSAWPATSLSTTPSSTPSVSSSAQRRSTRAAMSSISTDGPPQLRKGLDVDVTKKVVHMKDRTLHICLFGWHLSHIRRLEVIKYQEDDKTQSTIICWRDFRDDSAAVDGGDEILGESVTATSAIPTNGDHRHESVDTASNETSVENVSGGDVVLLDVYGDESQMDVDMILNYSQASELVGVEAFGTSSFSKNATNTVFRIRITSVFSKSILDVRANELTSDSEKLALADLYYLKSSEELARILILRIVLLEQAKYRQADPIVAHKEQKRREEKEEKKRKKRAKKNKKRRKKKDFVIESDNDVPENREDVSGTGKQVIPCDENRETRENERQEEKVQDAVASKRVDHSPVEEEQALTKFDATQQVSGKGKVGEGEKEDEDECARKEEEGGEEGDKDEEEGEDGDEDEEGDEEGDDDDDVDEGVKCDDRDEGVVDND
eukprot:m.34918 g.34918  ORF g.34918 m.34918 type:complete len:1109 (-) comp6567_c0_seq1:54-3380(-)